MLDYGTTGGLVPCLRLFCAACLVAITLISLLSFHWIEEIEDAEYNRDDTALDKAKRSLRLSIEWYSVFFFLFVASLTVIITRVYA